MGMLSHDNADCMCFRVTHVEGHGWTAVDEDGQHVVADELPGSRASDSLAPDAARKA